MSWLDISLPIEPSMVTYEGDPPVVCQPLSVVDPDDPGSCRVTQVTLTSHAGTHVDAPRHFVRGGAAIDEVSLELLCGPCRVLDLSAGPSALSDEILARHRLDGRERVLLKTANGPLLDRPFTSHYAHLDPSGARWLRDHGVRLVGIDYLSVEAAHAPGHPVHHLLLGAEPPVVIVEGLDLRGVASGDYELCVLPLRLAGADGAPARAMLRPLI